MMESKLYVTVEFKLLSTLSVVEAKFQVMMKLQVVKAKFMVETKLQTTVEARATVKLQIVHHHLKLFVHHNLKLCFYHLECSHRHHLKLCLGNHLTMKRCFQHHLKLYFRRLGSTVI